MRREIYSAKAQKIKTKINLNSITIINNNNYIFAESFSIVYESKILDSLYRITNSKF